MVLVAPGTSAGWAELCLGGSLDGLRLGSELLAWLGLEASRHVRHASRRAEGLRPVSDTLDKPDLGTLG